jgi:hypothetical protein
MVIVDLQMALWVAPNLDDVLRQRKLTKHRSVSLKGKR